MQYGISWSLHKSDLSSGLAQLQLNEEFVDMTLAAEGHLVKVHKNIVALASPYIKEMMKAIPSPHPIIFLNNVSHQVLKYLLEYIYTGEVQVPNNVINSFIETAKSLCIKGVEQIWTPEVNNDYNKQNDCSEIFRDPVESSVQNDIPSGTLEIQKLESNVAAQIRISDRNVFEIIPVTQSNELRSITSNNMQADKDFNAFSNNENINEEIAEFDLINISQSNCENAVDSHKQPINESFTPSICITYNNDGNNQPTTADISISEIVQSERKSYSPITDILKENIKDIIKARALTPLYTISNRGSLQLMLNRYMYCCHHQSFKGRKRRWRCVDYRTKHCKALVDTEDETITRRSGCHNHSYHDSKIVKKYKKCYVYTKIKDAEDSCLKHVKN